MADAGPRRSFFDLWSSFYDARLVQWAIYRPVHDAVLAALREPAARRIIDVGCGTGILTARMARELNTELVCGCDFSFGMLEQASQRHSGPLIQADAQHLPIETASVDAIVSTESFHWFPDPGGALAEFRRVLAPGGRLVVGMVNVRSAAASQTLNAASTILGEPAQWPTRAQMRDRIQNAGFRVIRQRRVARLGGVAFPTVLTVAARDD